MTRPCLSCSINIEVPDGKLIAVVGVVGSGKTSLLSAMLGEMTKVNGNVILKVLFYSSYHSKWFMISHFKYCHNMKNVEVAFKVELNEAS